MKLLDCGLVGLGSALGGVLRYVLGSAMTQRWPATLPLGTLIVNVSGCFLLGLVATTLGNKSESLRLFLGVGFCGGYTTFSTLMQDTAKLKPGPATGNIALSLALGLLAVWLGGKLGSYLGTR
ncbi:CrcB family protein [Armatimonas sp.]|uniref:fluoride efflux transporter FluC n=1 Tax=Armatimonas sp. TaxID=1872638 RepID=UPI00286ADF99|nr:CrcB family protein [Armatimonas sp.]